MLCVWSIHGNTYNHVTNTGLQRLICPAERLSQLMFAFGDRCNVSDNVNSNGNS